MRRRHVVRPHKRSKSPSINFTFCFFNFSLSLTFVSPPYLPTVNVFACTRLTSSFKSVRGKGSRTARRFNTACLLLWRISNSRLLFCTFFKDSLENSKEWKIYRFYDSIYSRCIWYFIYSVLSRLCNFFPFNRLQGRSVNVPHGFLTRLIL